MGCNAWNHPLDCRCGWGGDGHKGRGTGGGRRFHSTLPKSSKSFSCDFNPENRLTRCPICKSEVYFIRHNGGSVWLDPPLCPPWYKHPWFDKSNSSKNRSKLGEVSAGYSISTKFVVVFLCEFNEFANIKNLKCNFDDDEFYSFSIKGDARIFVGKICAFHPPAKSIWPMNEYVKKLYYRGEFFKHLNSNLMIDEGVSPSSKKVKETSLVGNKSSNKEVRCKVCGCYLSKEMNYIRHLLKVHGVCLAQERDVTGYMVVDAGKFYGEPASKEEGLCQSVDAREALASRKNDKNIFIVIETAYQKCLNESGWANLADVGGWLKKERPEFKAKRYGFKKLSELIESLGRFSIDKKDMNGLSYGMGVYINLKD
ncbi:OST-HTH/LOTUS domain-containing protein [Vreelandella aquamarina]